MNNDPTRSRSKNLFKELGKVFAVRLRGSRLPRPQQSTPTLAFVAPNTARGGAFIPSTPPTEISPPTLMTNVHESTPHYDFALSNRQLIVGAAKTGLQITAAAAEAVPVIGTTIKGSITAFLETLKAIERMTGNKEEIVLLSLRIRRLIRKIEKIKTTGQDSNRDWLYEEFLAMHDALEKLHTKWMISFATEKVSQVLNEFHQRIDDALTEYTALSQMDLTERVHGLQLQMSYFVSQGGPQRGIGTMVTIIDAVGRSFQIDAAWAMSSENIRKCLGMQFSSHHDDASEMLLEYITQGQYSLCIDEGRQVICLQNEREGMLLVKPGTRIVMNVILWQWQSRRGYKCPVCKTWNTENEALDIAMDCCNPKCEGRFQVIEKEDVRPGVVKINDHKLLQNIHIKQYYLLELALKEEMSEALRQ